MLYLREANADDARAEWLFVRDMPENENGVTNAARAADIGSIEREAEQMARIAAVEDAEQLALLNCEFNGDGETTLAHIRDSLRENGQEFVVVEDGTDGLAGFVCVQIKRSFCYDECMVEVTEVYVREAYRRQGVARRMLLFAGEYCRAHYPCRRIELLTGVDNSAAQACYARLGYRPDGEMHLAKELGGERADG